VQVDLHGGSAAALAALSATAEAGGRPIKGLPVIFEAASAADGSGDGGAARRRLLPQGFASLESELRCDTHTHTRTALRSRPLITLTRAVHRACAAVVLRPVCTDNTTSALRAPGAVPCLVGLLIAPPARLRGRTARVRAAGGSASTLLIPVARQRR
jgi:hypothetical protein